jgi:pyruvate formate lyase activating enzyme
MPSDRGIIFKIKKYALHDGPGIRTTVFLKGCPLTCWWCHNPEGQNPRPEVMRDGPAPADRCETVGREIAVVEVMEEIEKDVIFYDDSGGGVTFSGGEPLMQPEFLISLLTTCRNKEIHSAIDTSGFAPAEPLVTAAALADLILFDLKLIDERRHRQYTGVSNRQILDNLARISKIDTPVRLRFPVIPGITDFPENLEGIARIAGSSDRIEGIDLLPFHRIAGRKYSRLGLENRLQEIAPPSESRIAAVRKHFETSGFHVSIGG